MTFLSYPTSIQRLNLSFWCLLLPPFPIESKTAVQSGNVSTKSLQFFLVSIHSPTEVAHCYSCCSFWGNCVERKKVSICRKRKEGLIQICYSSQPIILFYIGSIWTPDQQALQICSYSSTFSRKLVSSCASIIKFLQSVYPILFL